MVLYTNYNDRHMTNKASTKIEDCKVEESKPDNLTLIVDNTVEP